MDFIRSSSNGILIFFSKMTPWLLAIFCLATAGCSNVTDQQTSESQHNQQVAILKQIRKVNEDGSYAFGYEAGDGSFKVKKKNHKQRTKPKSENICINRLVFKF